MDNTASLLREEYCPPIDEALFLAITSDYDLSSQASIQEVKALLDQLKESALQEDDVSFNPAGATSHEDSTSQDPSSSTDATSVSQAVSALSLDNSSALTDLEAHDSDTKLALLIDIFGDSINEDVIKHTLISYDDSFEKTLQDLTNLVCIQELEQTDTPVSKGIDGFASDSTRVSRKTKRRRNRAVREHSQDSFVSDDSASSVTQNKWQVAKEEVDFICQRVSNVSSAKVRLTYSQSGASLSQTIAALLTDDIHTHKSSPASQETLQLARELQEDFPTIKEEYCLALIRTASPSSAYAHELAKALAAKPVKDSMKIVPQYTRLTESDLDDTWQVSATPKSRAQAGRLNNIDFATARAQARAQAFEAHRKAKSDRSFGGVAAYYAQQARDYSHSQRAEVAAAADALADQQSSSSQVDLHGIDVLNGIRIAEERVQAWYAGLGENRVNGRLGAAQRSESFRIIVGAGRHSEGGKGKLGPAVTKMLKSQGWRFENQGAVIAVHGKAKS